AAFIANTLILASLYLALFALLKRLGVAILVVTAVFFLLGFASLGKMTYMHAALQPLDLLYIDEFMPPFGPTFGPVTKALLLVTSAAVAIALVTAVRMPVRTAVTLRGRAVVGALSLAVLAGAATSERHRPLRSALEAVGIELAGWDSVRSARQKGVLLEFLSLLPTAFIDAPARSSAAANAEAVRRYIGPVPAGPPGGGAGDTVR